MWYNKICNQFSTDKHRHGWFSINLKRSIVLFVSLQSSLVLMYRYTKIQNNYKLIQNKICNLNEKMNYSNEFEERKLLQIHHFLHIVHMNQFMKINHFIILTSTCPLKVFRFLNIEFNIGFCMNIIVRRKNVFFFCFFIEIFLCIKFLHVRQSNFCNIVLTNKQKTKSKQKNNQQSKPRHTVFFNLQAKN